MMHKLLTSFLLIFLCSSSLYSQRVKTDEVKTDDKIVVISGIDESMYKSTESEKAMKHYDAGLDFSRNNDLKSAEKEYLKAIKEDPQFIEPMDNLGVIYRKWGEYDKSIEYYLKSTEIYPKGIMAHQNLAVVYKLQNKYSDAIAEYHMVLELEPNHPEGYFGLASTYLDTKNYDLALENAQQALKLYEDTNSPYLLDGYNLVGMIHYYSGNTEEAKKYLKLVKYEGGKISPDIEQALFSDNSTEAESTKELGVADVIDWLQETPIDQDTLVRKEMLAALFLWMSETPNVSIEINSDVVNFVDCGECLLSFMGGWTKYTLATSEKKFKKLDANLAGIESVIYLYEKNKITMGKIEDIEEYSKLKKDGDLKKYIKSKL